MGWPFEKATWSAAEGAIYSAVGSETIWVLITVAMCVVALVVGSAHEKSAYRREEDKSGR